MGVAEFDVDGTRVVPEPEAEPEPDTADVGRVGDIDLRGQGDFSILKIELFAKYKGQRGCSPLRASAGVAVWWQYNG